MSQARVLNWQVARALAYLETRGLVHRDLKPQNIMVTKAGGENNGGGLVHSSSNGAAALTLTSTSVVCDLSAVLIDFGLARRVSDANEEAPFAVPCVSETMRRVATPAWSAIGSAGFMAPEQVSPMKSPTL